METKKRLSLHPTSPDAFRKKRSFLQGSPTTARLSSKTSGAIPTDGYLNVLESNFDENQVSLCKRPVAWAVLSKLDCNLTRIHGNIPLNTVARHIHHDDPNRSNPKHLKIVELNVRCSTSTNCFRFRPSYDRIHAFVFENRLGSVIFIVRDAGHDTSVWRLPWIHARHQDRLLTSNPSPLLSLLRIGNPTVVAAPN